MKFYCVLGAPWSDETPIPVGCGPTRGRRWAEGSSAARKDVAEGNRAIQNGGPAVPPLFHHLPAAAWLLRTASAEQSAPGKALLRSGGAPRFHVRSQPLALALQILDLGLEVRDFLLRRCKSFFQQ